ncbi:MAG: fumarylacetoacetate hydrolase family protein, partial [Oscillospiraceae bacterium]|nr:fumarylacetoacetate hydrolase family protein [Oscillospiraceae bacterium]
LVNGQVQQDANTRDMLFSPAELVSYISRFVTLLPGDLVFTGTPGGVQLGRPDGQRRWLRDGDKVEVAIEGIGTLENTIAFV